MSERGPRTRQSTTKRNLPSFIAQQNPHKQKNAANSTGTDEKRT